MGTVARTDLSGVVIGNIADRMGAKKAEQDWHRLLALSALAGAFVALIHWLVYLRPFKPRVVPAFNSCRAR